MIYPRTTLNTCLLCPSLTVPNLLPNEDELTIRVWSGIIPGHSGNDNDNDNQFEQCSSQLRQASTKVLNMFKKFVYPARIISIPLYAHWKRVVIVFVAQFACCILVILTVYYVIRACNISNELSVNVTW